MTEKGPTKRNLSLRNILVDVQNINDKQDTNKPAMVDSTKKDAFAMPLCPTGGTTPLRRRKRRASSTPGTLSVIGDSEYQLPQVATRCPLTSTPALPHNPRTGRLEGFLSFVRIRLNRRVSTMSRRDKLRSRIDCVGCSDSHNTKDLYRQGPNFDPRGEPLRVLVSSTTTAL